MAEYLIQGETLTAIADAVRAKTGSTDALTPAGIAALIESIEAGGGSDGSAETCELTITLHTVGLVKTRCFIIQEVSTDGTIQIASKELSTTRYNGVSATYTVLKGSLVFYHNNETKFDSGTGSSVSTTNAAQYFATNYFNVFVVGQEDAAAISVHP